MAGNVVGSIANMLAGNRSFKVTDETNFSISLSDIGVKLVSIKFSSKLMQNTSENGQPIIDSRVIMPTQISLSVLCNSVDKVDEVNSLLANTTSMYTIMSRGIKLEHFMLDTESMTQSEAMISATPMQISFKQVLLQDNGSPICAQSGDSSTILGGIKKSIEVAEEKITYLKDKLVTSASEFFG